VLAGQAGARAAFWAGAVLLLAAAAVRPTTPAARVGQARESAVAVS